jgi:hypothetical protein
MAKSIIDMGWTPPLYYTALKCRIHRVRLQAIRFLESSAHLEGMWDTQIAACVARKVMEVEEEGYYEQFEVIEDFSLVSTPDSCDLSLPTLPLSHRIKDIDVILPDGPEDSIFLLYSRKSSTGSWMTLRKEYHVPSQSWID